MRSLINGSVLDNRQIAEDIYRATIVTPDIAGAALPGQFINVYFPDSVKIFPRPFSIAGAEGSNIQLFYKVIGSQTELMSQWKPGDPVKILGPLGNSFEIPAPGTEIVLLAGGVGAAPLLFFRDRLYESGVKPKFFLGARTQNQLLLRADTKSELTIATDDGSCGSRGLVTAVFYEFLTGIDSPLTVCACGPDPMLKALKPMLENSNLAVYVSLEKTMACGLGLCQGCIVKNAGHNSSGDYSLVCRDGPVFNLRDIDFNA
ncbi:MAG TPA: dihydroorotate dehydrogenase electron transfer subunit [Candidatus Marinimicrobia bacterium]|nr:dihydroorotate dehydrogenase electron transfer subunit [Candidatus Neomarinimicrobiota bacterium]